MKSEPGMMTVEKGYKVTEVGVIPEEWEVVAFWDCLSITRGLIDPRKEPYIDMPHISPDCISKDTGRLLGFNTAREDNVKSGKYAFSPEDIVYSKIRPNLNKVVLPGFCGICSADMYPLSVNDSQASKWFMLYSLLSSRFVRFATDVSTRTGIPKINRDELTDFRFALPPLPEQEKIAEVLSTVDEHIGETEALIEKTETLKKGMMQRLLTRGIGHTEFKDTEIGRIPAKWEVRKLGDCVQAILGGGTPSRNVDEYYQGDIPWVTVKDLDGSFYMSEALEHISAEAVKESATNLVPIGSIVVATRMALGRGFINLNELAINQDLKALIPSDSVHPEYLLLFYLSIGHHIENQGSGSTVKGIRLEFLKALQLPLPPLPEQRKIADILTAIDDRIGEHRSKLEALTRLKSGLMQRLLTGKTRVKI